MSKIVRDVSSKTSEDGMRDFNLEWEDLVLNLKIQKTSESRFKSSQNLKLTNISIQTKLTLYLDPCMHARNQVQSTTKNYISNDLCIQFFHPSGCESQTLNSKLWRRGQMASEVKPPNQLRGAKLPLHASFKLYIPRSIQIWRYNQIT